MKAWFLHYWPVLAALFAMSIGFRCLYLPPKWRARLCKACTILDAQENLRRDTLTTGVPPRIFEGTPDVHYHEGDETCDAS